MDPDREVRRADRARAEADRRTTGQLSVGLGHECCAALVSRGDDPDPGVAERIQDAKEGLARNGEGVPDARGSQRVGDEPPDGSRTRRDRFGFRLPRARVREVGRLGDVVDLDGARWFDVSVGTGNRVRGRGTLGLGGRLRLDARLGSDLGLRDSLGRDLQFGSPVSALGLGRLALSPDVGVDPRAVLGTDLSAGVHAGALRHRCDPTTRRLIRWTDRRWPIARAR